MGIWTIPAGDLQVDAAAIGISAHPARARATEMRHRAIADQLSV